MRVLRGRLSVCECASFPLGFEGGMWDLIALVPDHCRSLYFQLFCINGSKVYAKREDLMMRCLIWVCTA